MTTKKLSPARQYLSQLRGKSLTLGGMIESLRETDGVSQTELAHRLNVSRAHLCDIEKGRRVVTLERAAQLAKVMGYSVDQFLAVAVEEQLRRAGLPRKVKLEAA